MNDDGDAAHSLKTRMINFSSVRVHRHAVGGRKEDQEPVQLGRSRGGLGTQGHAVVDGKGCNVEAFEPLHAREGLARASSSAAVACAEAWLAGG